MSADNLNHNHSDDDIIIKDQDGSYKILKDGKFVNLDDAEQKAHGVDKEAKPVVPESPKAPEDLNLQKATEAIKKSGITFPSTELKNRTEKILISHYKEVRKPFEVKETLMKSPDQGGVGLEASDVKKLMGDIALDDPSKKRPVIDESLSIKPKSFAVKPMVDAKVGAELAPPAKLDLKKDLEIPTTPKPSQPLRPTTVPKPAVSDVHKPNMPTVGLAGELNYSLTDWRRLNPNPKDRIKKIENQLGVLEQESYPERIRGLQAWRNSQVMGLYVKAGTDSLDTGKAIKDILGDGSGTGLSFLEWEAVAQLNKRIRS
jgi:hypothetical protein